MDRRSERGMLDRLLESVRAGESRALVLRGEPGWMRSPARPGHFPRCGQQLLVLTPADAEARERLELLPVLGIEEFPTGLRARPCGRAQSWATA